MLKCSMPFFWPVNCPAKNELRSPFPVTVFIIRAFFPSYDGLVLPYASSAIQGINITTGTCFSFLIGNISRVNTGTCFAQHPNRHRQNAVPKIPDRAF